MDQIDDPPANHAMRSRDRTLFDDLGQRPLMLGSKHRTRARRLAVKQALGPAGVEAQNPVSDRLQTDTADLRRRLPRTTIVNHRKRQQPTNLVRIATQPGQPSKTGPVKIVSKPNRRCHRKPPTARDVESDHSRFGNPPR